MVKPALHIVSQFHGSLGEIIADLIPHLKKEFVVTEEFKQGPAGFDILLCHYVNPLIVEDDSFLLFKKKVLIQPIDGTNLTKYIVYCLNQFDLIITPSLAGKNILINSGVTCSIEIIPNYYKEAILNTNNSLPKELPTDKFIFYHESTCVQRKGVDILYEAFIKAFSDNEYTDKVVLVVKDSPLNKETFEYKESCKRNAIALQKQYKNPANIIKISQFLKEETLRSIWHNVNAYVSFAKIEGFGIPLLRMAVLQKPIVTLENLLSGYSDFLDNSNCYTVPTKQIIAEEEKSVLYSKKSQWAIPTDINLAVEQLLACYEDVKANKQKLVLLDAIDKELDYYSFDNIKQKYTYLLKNL